MRLTAASSCNASLPITCTGVSPEGAVLFSEGDAGSAIPGFAFEKENVRSMSFSGVLEASAVNTATDYQFSVNDSDAGILYTRDTGTKTVAASPVFEVENDVLKPSYDAAHVALKGLWRLPTKEEFSLLVKGTTNSFADGGMTFSGAGQTMFLPATGFLSATTHVQPGTYTCYGQPIRPVFSIAF